ncbi:MAG: tRNA lysidine(34) synthetase TilS [Ruminococcus flavefaciens]|nr:tRNA lysidine(34) synthetase TilS [Ruminococcus flavefaciens]
MTNKIFSFIKKHNMINKGDTVICGLSGGADSVCLLLVLQSISSKLDFTVKALHVNHCIRGEESDRDENFCRELCRKINVPFTAVSCNVKAFAEENQLSIEESARKLRYGIFAENSKSAKIATAHNANDNLETMIFNLTRGSALKGLAGIPPVRDNIIRPLLAVSRAEIEEYLSSIGQDYVTDSTNLSDDYTRNKIRHLVLPVLCGINPAVIETSVNSSEALRSENSLIEEQTEKALSVCRHGNKLCGLNEFHEVVRRRCIARLLSDNSLPYSYDRLSEMDSILMNGGKINISGDIFFVSDGKNAELKKILPVSELELISAELKTGENMIFPDRIFSCEIILCDDLQKIYDVHKKLTFYLLDYDKIIGRVILRNRRFGDRIRLSGKNFTSSVKKLINEKVPSGERERLHFLEDDAGTIFAEKLGIAERVVPDSNTVRFLKISVKNK